MYIESAQNDKVRAWGQLKSKKGRIKHTRFLVEGKRVIEELLNSPYDIDALLWNVATDDVAIEMLEHPKLHGRVFSLSPTAFSVVSDTTTSQGLIAVAHLPSNSPANKLQNRAILLDGMQDPGNVGTIFRSADAFGFASVCCGSNTVDPFSPKVVRSAMGGMFRLQLATMESLDYITRWRKQYQGGFVIIASADADVSCQAANLSGDILFVIGSEAFGPSAAAESESDLSVAIPMSGQTESLNAAAAASILLYEAFRQRMET